MRLAALHMSQGRNLTRPLVTALRAVVRPILRVSPERWFLIGFALLLAAFVAALFVLPSSVGRGGR